jgi:alpha-galactosidase
MTRIAMISAGSVVFVRTLLTDFLTLPELRDCAIALHDIDPERLETANLMARAVAAQLDASPTITAHADRRAAVAGADFVINMVQIGMHAATLLDFDIPRRHGLKQTIADTVGIGGIFRGLRTIPFMLDLVRDMRALCQNALLLNCTNPMSILTWAVYDAFPDQPVVGLCHNVQNTARELAVYLGVARERLSYDCAGINHMTWFLRLMLDGQDTYPALHRAAEDPSIFARDRVRFELLRQLGWFESESSERSAEYTPYFLRREDQVAAYAVPVDEYVRRSEENLRIYQRTRQALLAGEKLTFQPSEEYGARIIHALTTGEPTLIYGNVRNTRLIDNLPEDCCVEVPVVVDRNGLRPCHVGKLPPELAAHCAPHVFVQELTMRAACDRDKARVYRAAMLDCHAASTLSIGEIRAMVDDLIAAHGDALPFH